MALAGDGGRERARRCACAGVGIDDVAHLDLYSCFASSLHFARDALGIATDDSARLTVTGGLPYHGGPGSDYLTHSIAAMVDVLRDDPAARAGERRRHAHAEHVYGVYSTTPGPVAPPDGAAVQAELECGATARCYATPSGACGRSRPPASLRATTANPAGPSRCATSTDGDRCYARVVDTTRSSPPWRPRNGPGDQVRSSVDNVNILTA